jgi:hypothetical protein
MTLQKGEVYRGTQRPVVKCPGYRLWIVISESTQCKADKTTRQQVKKWSRKETVVELLALFELVGNGQLTNPADGMGSSCD